MNDKIEDNIIYKTEGFFEKNTMKIRLKKKMRLKKEVETFSDKTRFSSNICMIKLRITQDN